MSRSLSINFIQIEFNDLDPSLPQAGKVGGRLGVKFIKNTALVPVCFDIARIFGRFPFLAPIAMIVYEEAGRPAGRRCYENSFKFINTYRRIYAKHRF